MVGKNWSKENEIKKVFWTLKKKVKINDKNDSILVLNSS